MGTSSEGSQHSGIKMKKDFVKKWCKSVQPRKQRKYRYNAPIHTSGSFLTVTLSKELRKLHGTRNIRVRKNDKIVVLRGQHKKKTGKVERVSVKYSKVYVTGIDLVRKDGTKSLIPLQPSNLMISELDKTDKKRSINDKNVKLEEKNQNDKETS
jgi:large subunit ribosomal protein L24